MQIMPQRHIEPAHRDKTF